MGLLAERTSQKINRLEDIGKKKETNKQTDRKYDWAK